MVYNVSKLWNVCTSQSLVQIKLKTAFHSRGASNAVLDVCAVCTVPNEQVCVCVYVCVAAFACVLYVVGFRHCTGACWILLLILFFVFFWVLGDCTEDDIDNRQYYNRSMRMAFSSSCLVPRTHFTLLLAAYDYPFVVVVVEIPFSIQFCWIGYIHTLRWPDKPGNCKCKIPTKTTAAVAATATAAARVKDVARFFESPYDKTITFQRGPI